MFQTTNQLYYSDYSWLLFYYLLYHAIYFTSMYHHISYIYSRYTIIIPVLRKAVAEVSQIGYYIGEVICCDAWMAERTLSLSLSLTLSVTFSLSL